MRSGYRAVVGALGMTAMSQLAVAQAATQVVRFQVTAVSQVGLSGVPAPLVVNSAVAGAEPSSVIAYGATYSVTTNESNQKITASLDQILPAGLTLAVQLAAPDGAVSTGIVPLGTASADLVVGISSVAASALPIMYRLSAAPTAAVTGAATRTVTFTIVSGS